LQDRKPALPAPQEEQATELIEFSVADDRSQINPGDRVLLIVEDDPHYAALLLEMAHSKGFKGVIASHGAAALSLARELKPDAITLDLRLPDLDGRRVLDRLKVDFSTRHIPVHVISVCQDDLVDMPPGAFGFLTKTHTRDALEQTFSEIKMFVERPVKNLLVVEDDDVQIKNIRELIGNGDVHTTAVKTGKEALEELARHKYDCMILDLKLPDMPGMQLLEAVKNKQGKPVPTLVYTGMELQKDQQAQLKTMAEAILIKDARAPERLLDKASLILHRNVSKLPDKQRQMLTSLHHAILEGKKVLVVDDDVRNIFAMTSVLERFEMKVVSAENGKDAIDLLVKNKNEIDIVLMDIMLPAMDGYETIRTIRQIAGFEEMPIIAVTAKAMKGDREKCIAAGASDYIAKPVDREHLRSVLHVWLHR
jgi:CheY-like chemotaxis protein